MLIAISAVFILVMIYVALTIHKAIAIIKYHKETNKPSVPKGEFRV